jgi:predicted NAD-dependent protein-ADP-ribosyltransferase YbiA (DUF1768 family)
MERDCKRAITDHFTASARTQQEVLAELPHVQAETIQFHSFSKSDGHSYLSNMFPCVRFHRYGLPRTAPFVDPKEGGMEFDSVECFYQYHRFLATDERYASEVILPAEDAKAVATASGKRVYEKWWKQNHGGAGELLQFEENDVFDRDEVMRKGLRLKFTQHVALKEALLATKDAPLEEIGRFDGEYWTNKGKNRLGQLLMELREELRTELKK